MSEPVSSPSAARFLRQVAIRLRAVRLARWTHRSLLALAGVYAIALLVGRLLGVLPVDFTPLSLLMLPVLALLAGAACARPPGLRAAARRADTVMGTDDLFLTAALLDASPGEYQALVRRDAEARAAEAKPAAVVPYAWTAGARNGLVAMCGLWIAVLFLPQLDPFGQQEELEKQRDQRQALEESRKATELRTAALQQKVDKGPSAEVDQALEALKNTFNTMRPFEPTKNVERLQKHQQELGQIWQKANAKRMREGSDQRLARQNFGMDNKDRKAWKRELKQGRTDSLRRQLQSLQDLAKRAAETKDPAKRRELDRELKRKLSQLAEFAGKDLQSKPMQSAVERALEQLKSGQTPELSDEALAAMQESLQLAQSELSQAQQNLEDMQALEDALRSLQMAQQANRLEPLDGGKCGDCKSMGDYASLYESLMGEGQGQGKKPGYGEGMKGPGTGEGGTAPFDDETDSDFQSVKAKSALRAGKILMKWQSDENAERGQSLDDYATQMKAVEQGVNEAILQEQIPPGYHEGIQQYFDSIKEQHASTPSTGTP